MCKHTKKAKESYDSFAFCIIIDGHTYGASQCEPDGSYSLYFSMCFYSFFFSKVYNKAVFEAIHADPNTV